jgi:hypothetical protein
MNLGFLLLTDYIKNLGLGSEETSGSNPEKFLVLNLSFSLLTDHCENLSLSSEEAPGAKS